MTSQSIEDFVVPKKREFEHESLQDAETVAEYLNTIISGVRTGKLTLSNNEGDIELRPKGLIRFIVRATERSDRHRITLKLTWKPGLEGAELDGDPLQISIDD